MQDAFRAGQHFAKHYPLSMDRMQQLSKQDPNLPLVSNGKTGNELRSSQIEQRAMGHSVIDSSNMTVTSNLDSTVTGSSVTTNSSIPDSFVSETSDSLHNINVPEPATKVNETESSPMSGLLGKRRRTESSLLAQLNESKSKILGFRSSQADRKDKQQDESLEILKGNYLTS